MADNVCKCWENPLLTFAGPKQSLCCSGLVCEGTDGQLFTVCGSFPSALCNLTHEDFRLHNKLLQESS